MLFHNIPLLRPLLDHELAVMGDIPALVHTANPRVLVTQPSTKLDPRSREVRVSVASSVFSVDMAFGPEDDNQVVYTNTVPSLLDTSLKVSLCCNNGNTRRMYVSLGRSWHPLRIRSDGLRKDSHRDRDH